MKKFLTSHPYTVTSSVFIIIVAFGFLYLDWRRDEYAFALLLYFIVTLGVRLDDISRQLGIGHTNPATLADHSDRVIHLMQEIQRALAETNQKLAEIQATMERKAEP
jgi:hypothetical protein